MRDIALQGNIGARLPAGKWPKKQTVNQGGTVASKHRGATSARL
jgi:hypothetical protein